MSNLRDQLSRFSEGSPFTPYDEKTGGGLERPDPTEEELRVPYAAPGRRAEERGVLYRADHETLDDGMCRQARTHACALRDAGVPIALRTIANQVRHGSRSVMAGDDELHPDVFEQVGALRRASFRQTLAVVYHTVIHSSRQLWRLLVPGYLQNDPKAIELALARSVVYTPWERDRVDAEIIELLNQCGQVWLQCQRNVEAFVGSGLAADKVRIVPNAYVPSSAPLPLRVARGRRFYNIGKWEPRKNQHGLIGAFLRAFGPDDDASLFIKTIDYRPWPSYPALDESVGLWLAVDELRDKGWTPESVERHLFIHTRTFSEEEIARLHRLSNIYVSASHAEGWDYPAFDAVAAGNRLVHVGFGGPEDFAPPSTIAVPWKRGPVNPDYNWEPGAEWAEYAEEDLVRALAAATPLPTRVPPDLTRFTSQSVGKLMRAALEELVEIEPAEGG